MCPGFSRERLERKVSSFLSKKPRQETKKTIRTGWFLRIRERTEKAKISPEAEIPDLLGEAEAEEFEPASEPLPVSNVDLLLAECVPPAFNDPQFQPKRCEILDFLKGANFCKL